MTNAERADRLVQIENETHEIRVIIMNEAKVNIEMKHDDTLRGSIEAYFRDIDTLHAEASMLTMELTDSES